MRYLLYIFELILLTHPTAYYIPAFETGNPAVVITLVIINVAFVKSVQYFADILKWKPIK